MKINEAAKLSGLSKRAVKFYEEQGLIQVKRGENGYRIYSQENVEQLKEISAYRKLGIGLADIRALQSGQEEDTLKRILKEKKRALEEDRAQTEALRTFLEGKDGRILEILDYETVAQAIKEAVPGFYGFYFLNHFLPYLQIRIETEEQKQAYQNILRFWDETTIRIPPVTKFWGWIMYRFFPKPSLQSMADHLDETLRTVLSPTEEEYARLKKRILAGARMKQNILYKYSIAGIEQRRLMKELKNKGYYDLFIPNMIALSPKYRAYHEALMRLNDRLCRELGLYYDANYQLVLK